MVLRKKSEKEQDLKESKESPAPPGRKQMWALWVAALTALSSTGVPKIVEMLQDKPSIEQVQYIVTEHTKKLTDSVNTLVEAVKEMSDDLEGLKSVVPHTSGVVSGITGRLDLLQGVLRNCCTRRSVRAKLDKPPEPDPELVTVKNVVEPKHARGMKPVERLRKLPQFNVQQQLQLQMQQAPE